MGLDFPLLDGSEHKVVKYSREKTLLVFLAISYDLVLNVKSY